MNIVPVPIDTIDEDVANHRLISDPESDRQLKESIAANGVQQPIKVASKGGGRFTLVFGFRRKAAAAAAGMTTIPAIVEQGLDENSIRALQAIENLERRELHPMEEAQFCQDLARTLTLRPGKDDSEELAEAIAQRIGRSRKWVELRLSMARLSPRVKDAFTAGDIHLQHAQLIARLVSHEAQEEVLGTVRAQDSHWLTGRDQQEAKQPPRTISETRQLVERHLRDLDNVAWKLDAVFADLPSCSTCPNNSANRLDLFDGDQPKKPQCLDATCYAQKNKTASRAVIRATNTAIKTAAETDKKITPTTARAAIVSREVGFIRDQAVVDSAKKRQSPDQATAAESRGYASYQINRAASTEYWDQCEQWVDQFHERIDGLLPIEDPIGIAMMALIAHSAIITNGNTEKFRAAMKLLEGTGYPEEDLIALAKLLKPDLEPDREYPSLMMLDENISFGYDEPYLDIIAEVYGIEDLPPKPDHAAIKEQIKAKQKTRAARLRA